MLIIDAETGLLSHPSTFEWDSPNSGASSERITRYNLIIKHLILICKDVQDKSPCETTI
jgi:hypothetical protein